MRALTLLLCAAVISFCLIATLAHPETYTVVDLGTLAAHAFSEGLEVNKKGHVAGLSSSAAHQKGCAFFWDGGLWDIGPLPGGTFNFATAVNDSDIVVGYSNYKNSGQSEHAFMWTRSTGLVDLGALPGGKRSAALGIGSKGQVVGWSDTRESAGQQLAFLWTKTGGMRNLGKLPGGTFSQAFAINSKGHVVGGASFAQNVGTTHAFSWTPTSGMRDLGTLPGGGLSLAYSINDEGIIAGYSLDDHSHAHAVLWTSNGISDLGYLPGGTYAYATSINALAQVVGYGDSAKSAGTSHALIWTQHSGLQDLNDLIPAISGWVLNVASGINKAGQITGSGTRSGFTERHAFLLTPQ